MATTTTRITAGEVDAQSTGNIKSINIIKDCSCNTKCGATTTAIPSQNATTGTITTISSQSATTSWYSSARRRGRFCHANRIIGLTNNIVSGK